MLDLYEGLLPEAPEEPKRGGDLIATGGSKETPVVPSAPKRVVRYSAPREEAKSVGERYFADLGGNAFVGDVLRLSQSQPKPDPHDSARLAAYRQREEMGEDYRAEIAALQQQIRAKERNASIHSEITSALAMGDRQRLKAALGQLSGGQQYRDRL